jgi:HK97 family phage portal protein
MGLLSTLEQRAGPPPWEDWWYTDEPAAAFRHPLSPDEALGASAVWAATQYLAGKIAAFPLKLYRRRNGRTSLARDLPEYRVLAHRPNAWQTDFEWREMSQGHQSLRGNAYSQIIRDRVGRLQALIPLNPARMKVVATADSITYEFQRQDGTTAVFAASDILHLRGMSGDGVQGYSLVQVAREALRLGLAGERHGNRLFQNDSRPRGVLTTDQKLSKEARDQLKDAWAAAQGGDALGKVAVLENGLNWTQVGLSAEDAQWIEGRTFQIQEVARFWNVPPHKLRDHSRSTFSNIEESNIEVVVDTLTPLTTRWERRLGASLLPDRDPEEYFFRFNMDAALRGNAEARTAMYSGLFQLGVMSPNEIREKEDMDPVDGGDERFVQLNLIPLSQAAQGLADINAGPPAADEGRGLPAPETRGMPFPGEQRSLRSRRRILQSYLRLLTEAGGRIVRREVGRIRDLLAILESGDLAEFDRRVVAMYEQHEVYIRDQMTPLLAVYASLIADAAREEVGLSDDITESQEALARSYSRTFAGAHSRRSQGILARFIAENQGAALVAGVTALLDSWVEDRPRQIGEREAVSFGAAAARMVYDAAGFTTVWRTTGNETCPLCERLNGRVVGRGQPFLEPGDVVDPEDGETTPFEVSDRVSHPSLHSGCDCTVVAGRS